MNEKARKLHNEAIVIDGHNQLMLELSRRADRGEKKIFSSYFVPMMHKGRVNMVDLVVGGSDPSLNNRTDILLYGPLSMMDLLLEEEVISDDFRICRSAKDIDEATANGKIAVLMKLEGSRPIEGKPHEDSLCLLRSLYRLGLRGISIVGNGRTRMADGVGESVARAGLTTFGVEVIKEMNRLGMVIDVVHMTDRCFWDILEITTHPIADSHTMARALCDIPRNLSDARLKAMAQNGGVIGMIFQKALIKKSAYTSSERVTFDHVVEHIDYIANLVGSVDNIGIGSDIDEFVSVRNIHEAWAPAPGYIEDVYYGIPVGNITIEGPDSLDKYPLITEALVKHGYADEDIKKLLGKNWLRLYRQVLG
jgi:membrane dipeptidase